MLFEQLELPNLIPELEYLRPETESVFDVVSRRREKLLLLMRQYRREHSKVMYHHCVMQDLEM